MRVFKKNGQRISWDTQISFIAPKLPLFQQCWESRKVQIRHKWVPEFYPLRCLDTLWAASHRRLQMLLQHCSERASPQVKTHPPGQRARLLITTFMSWHRDQVLGSSHIQKTNRVYTHLQSTLLFGQNIRPSPKPQKWRGKWDSPDNEGRGRCLNIFGSDFQKNRLRIIPSLIQEDWTQELFWGERAIVDSTPLDHYLPHILSLTHMHVPASLFSIYNICKTVCTLGKKCWCLLKPWHLLRYTGLC